MKQELSIFDHIRASDSARDEFGKTPLDYALEQRRKIDAEREQMAALL
ncbi:MAG TPA: hypothetical protein PLB32_19835 [Acidobacteriota bacterium]|nr:hypothetical protein [Acidobacteriota bacterium]